MKKTYVKPFVSFESFELSASIAGTCVEKTYHDKGACGYYVPELDEKLFNITGVCTLPTPDGEYEGLCYHSTNGNLFTS